MRGTAQKMGYKLSDCELINLKTNKSLSCPTEHDVFKALGMPYTTPKDRDI